jgi:hypothetical protein
MYNFFYCTTAFLIIMIAWMIGRDMPVLVSEDDQILHVVKVAIYHELEQRKSCGQ